MRHLTLLILTIISLQAAAQKKIVWFDAGLKAQYGAAGFYNAAVGSSDNFDYTISKGFSYGAKLGINKNFNGLSLEVMRSTAEQAFDPAGTNPLAHTVDWSSTDVYALFRNAQNLGYFEIGPKVSFINKVSNQVGDAKSETTSKFNENVFSGVVGFGANVMGNEGSFSGILGLRFEYGITDFNKEADPSNLTTAPLGDATIYADGYKKSNIAFAGVVFELNWGIGYYGKAQCGKRSKFIMF